VQKSVAGGTPNIEGGQRGSYRRATSISCKLRKNKMLKEDRKEARDAKLLVWYTGSEGRAETIIGKEEK